MTWASTRGSTLAKVPTAPEILPTATVFAGRHQRGAAPRPGVVPAGQLEAEGDGLGVDAVAAPDHGGAPVLQGPLLHRRQHPVDAAEQQRRGLGQLHRQGGVEHVGGGHALVEVARRRTALLLGPGEEGDDVVLDRLLDLLDARHVGGGQLVAVEDLAEGGEVLGRHLAQRHHGLAGQQLDVEPDAVSPLAGPDAPHLGAGVARDHVVSWSGGAGHRPHREVVTVRSSRSRRRRARSRRAPPPPAG